MTKEERMEYSIGVINKLIKEADIDMTLDEFVKVYSSNRGITCSPINVCNNIEKYQLTSKGNYKYLFKILEDRLNFMQENPKFDQLDYISKFTKQNYKHYHLAVSLKDQDVIEQIEKQESKNGYIVNLIKEDIKRNKE